MAGANACHWHWRALLQWEIKGFGEVRIYDGHDIAGVQAGDE
jgi:hypothetical protein